jgi:arabinose-5-phosphate isomerase
MRLSAADLMHAGRALPRVREEAPLRDALVEILEKRIGVTAVVDGAGRLCGVITDGDLKRILLAHAGDANRWALRAGEVMTRTPRTCTPETRVAAAVRLMEENEGGAITSLVVLGAGGVPLGILHLHDCLRAGVR